MKILQVKNLSLLFTIHKEKIYPIRNVSFDLFLGETIGIVGESGSGKTVCTQSLVKLIPSHGVQYLQGSILFENEDLFPKSEKELRSFRGHKIGYIFQDPMTSLNPVMKIGKQILEAIKEEKSKQKVYDLLHLAGINNPKERFSQYPYELSGGQRQRIMIAIALAMQPKILVADEPTTALDVTIQAQILHLLKEIQKNKKTSIIFISHDLKIVANVADRILVMYAGKIIEEGPADLLLNHPKHPYSQLLLQSVPTLFTTKKLKTIEGTPPEPFYLPQGCSFAPRCPFAKKECFENPPPYFILKNKQKARCWLYR